MYKLYESCNFEDFNYKLTLFIFPYLFLSLDYKFFMVIFYTLNLFIHFLFKELDLLMVGFGVNHKQ